MTKKTKRPKKTKPYIPYKGKEKKKLLYDAAKHLLAYMRKKDPYGEHKVKVGNKLIK